VTERLDIKNTLKRLADGHHLSEEEAYELALAMLKGHVDQVEIASILTALRVRGETVDEVVGFARALRECCIKIPVEDIQQQLLDTAGTGGDGYRTVNVSTVAALIVAACGGKVLKHGNRSVSSKSGSADFLEALGYRIDMEPEQVRKMIDLTNFGFAFAQKYHPLMRSVANVRRALGFRTIFNLVGPLSNPGGVKRQVLGVADERLLKLYAEACPRLGYVHVLLVHGYPGIDEVSIFGPTKIVEIKKGTVEEYVITPEELCLQKSEDIHAVQVENPHDSVNKVLKALSPNSKGPVRDFIVINTAVALYCSGIVKDLKDGVELCSKTIDDGVALEYITKVVETSRKV